MGWTETKRPVAADRDERSGARTEFSMSPKRSPSDAMTLRELGVADVDCAFDPDGFLDGPPADGVDGDGAPASVDDEDPVEVDDPPRQPPTS